MSYKVTVLNKYTDGSKLKLAFDTNTVLLHEARAEAEIEVYTERMNKRQNPAERPIFSTMTFTPMGGK